MIDRVVSLRAAVAAILVVASGAAHAEQSVAFYAGEFDVFDENYPALGMEWRGDNLHLGLRPIVGLQVDDQKDVYGYGGLAWDVPLSERVYMTPSFAVGGYHHGDGLDLGGGIEFRSGIEGSYKLENNSRIGLALNHVSNAGLYGKNPGAETLAVTWVVPFSLFK